MNKLHIKRMMTNIIAAAFVAMSGMTALAADAVIIDGTGKYAGSTTVDVKYYDKDLFSNMKELMPGSTVANTVSLENRSGRAVTIYMKAYPNFEEEQDVFSAIRERVETALSGDKSEVSVEGKSFNNAILDLAEMTLTLDDAVIYKGSADGSKPEAGYQGLTEGDYGINLGKFSSDEVKTLKIELYLPGEKFTNEYASTFDAVDWVFCAEGTTPSGGDSSKDPTKSTVSVNDGEVPGGASPSISKDVLDNSVLQTVDDSQIPLGILPALGDNGVIGYVIGLMVFIMIGVGAVYIKKRTGHL